LLAKTCSAQKVPPPPRVAQQTHRLMTPSPSPSARANSTCAGELSGPASAPTSLRSSADCRGNRQRISNSAGEQTRVRDASWR
jgi:hypothetical protein